MLNYGMLQLKKWCQTRKNEEEGTTCRGDVGGVSGYCTSLPEVFTGYSESYLALSVKLMTRYNFGGVLQCRSRSNKPPQPLHKDRRQRRRLFWFRRAQATIRSGWCVFFCRACSLPSFLPSFLPLHLFMLFSLPLCARFDGFPSYF